MFPLVISVHSLNVPLNSFCMALCQVPFCRSSGWKKQNKYQQEFKTSLELSIFCILFYITELRQNPSENHISKNYNKTSVSLYIQVTPAPQERTHIYATQDFVGWLATTLDIPTYPRYREVLNFLDRLAACALIGDWFVNSWEAGASFADDSVVRQPTKFGMK
jgi:hypothetical protein